MSTYHTHNRDLWDGDVYLGIEPEIQPAFPQDEYEDGLFNSTIRANQSQSPD